MVDFYFSSCWRFSINWQLLRISGPFWIRIRNSLKILFLLSFIRSMKLSWCSGHARHQIFLFTGKESMPLFPKKETREMYFWFFISGWRRLKPVWRIQQSVSLRLWLPTQRLQNPNSSKRRLQLHDPTTTTVNICKIIYPRQYQQYYQQQQLMQQYH